MKRSQAYKEMNTMRSTTQAFVAREKNSLLILEAHMINRMKNIFDYQRFSPNSRLSEMIDTVEQRYTELQDEDLFFVAAAGESYRMDDENDTPVRKT